MKKRPATPRKLSDKRKNTHPSRAQEEKKAMLDRNHREKILKISEIRYRRLFEAARDGILLLDAKTGQITDVNPYLMEMLGYSHQEFLGKKLWEIGLFKDIVANQAGFQKLQKEKFVRYEHLSLETKEGGHVDVEFVSNLYEEDHKAVIQCNIRNITQRKHSEDEIRQSLSLLKATLESTADGILVVDRQGKIVSFNQNFIRMWRIPDSIIDTRDDDQALAFVLDQLQNPQGFLNKVRELYRQPEDKSFDVLEFKDDRIFERYSRPQKIGEDIVGRMWSFRDVTERRRAEETLLQEKYFSDKIIDSLPGGFFVANKNGYFVRWNKNHLIITEYSEEEMHKINALSMIAEEDRDLIRQKIEEVFEKGHAVTEAIVLTKSGKRISFLLTGTRAVIGDQVYLLGVSIDITDRKQVEMNLLRMQKEWEGIFQGIGHPAMILDPEHGVITANRATLKALGKSEEEVMHRRCYELFHGTNRPPQGCPLEGLNVSSHSETVEMQVKALNGTFLVSCTPIFDDAGKLYRVVHIATDITERKQFEEDLQESKNRFQAQYQGNPTPTFTWQRKGDDFELVDYNAAADAITKGKVKNFVGKTAGRMYQNRPDILQDFHRCFEEKVVIKKEMTSQNFMPGKDVIVTCVYVPSDLVMIHIEDITERKRAEEALKESESRFRNIIETSSDGIIFFEQKERKILFGNNAMAKLLRCSREDLVGMSLPFKHPPEELEEIEQRFQKHMSGDLTVSTEIPILRDDGSVFYADITSCNITLDGKAYLATFFRDITERKQAEEALKQEKERVQNYLDVAGVMLVAINADQEVILINKKGCEILGYEENEILGKKWFDHFIPEQNRERIRNIFSKLTTGDIEPVEYYENTVLTKRGKERIIAWHNTIIKGKDDHIIGTLSSGEDITDRKQAEEALRESEDRYRTAIENSIDGVTLVQENRYLFVNQKFVEIFGYDKPDEIIEKPISVVVHPDDLKRVEGMTLARQRGESAPSVYEFKGMRKNGDLIDIEVSANRIIYRGIPVSLAYLRDITDRKLAEKEKAELQEQLRQSQKMEGIGKLAGGIAHDFNNLLTIIEGYCQLSLMEIREADPLRENIYEVRKAADHAAFLTRQLLAFSRRQILEMKVLDPNILLQNLDKMLRRVIGEDIELMTLLDENLGRIKSDPGQIEQVMMNLAVNAKDAMPNGGKLIIETANVHLDEAYAQNHASVTPGPYVMISVSDTGTGMLPEIRDRIFEPFFTTKEVGKGTGLGLSTVYGIIKQSGGNIWVYSEPGQGTTFKIYFPRVEAPPEVYREKAEREELPRGSETILVVEDDEDVRKLAVRVLQRQGYHILEASQGGEALLICEKHRDTIHLMLTDVVMPGMSGRDLADRLHSLHPEMKVLYMSGYTGNAIVHQGILEEGIDFIQKPFALDMLAKKVREVLDRSQSKSE